MDISSLDLDVTLAGMTLLTLRDAELAYGDFPLLDHAQLSVQEGERIGLIGRNGTGKSTLLKVVTGLVNLDDGAIERRDGLRIACVEQEPVLPTAPDEHDWKLAMYLERFGVELVRAAATGSGGERKRAALAAAFASEPDLLLLDEPTNHLDLDAIVWLEGWLTAYPGTLLLISHDREFLDRVVNRIVNIEHGKARAYRGNYSSFEEQRATELSQQAALYARQQREIRHMESFVERFRAKASKARQAQSRLKWLARLQQIAPLQTETQFEWEFLAPAKLPRPLLTLEQVRAGFGAHCVLHSVSLTLNPGERLGILGRNGAGKSTLMRVLAGQLAPLAGSRTPGADLVPGFLQQLELEQLDVEASALSELARRGGEVAAWTPQQSRDYLGRFGFGGERVFEPVGRFSGGERARLALAILIARRPNLLLLDEPTNHLDLGMRQTLLLALQEFAGAVVIVSHDRALLRGSCDRFALVADGTLVPYEGDLEDYAAWLSARRAAERPGAAPDKGPSRRTLRQQEAAARKRLSPLRSEGARLEQQLSERSAERQRIEQQLADPATYAAATPAERAELARRHGQLSQEIEQLEARWLEVLTALEAPVS
jgi:ATP-binding cassette, subfamily F, member 3